MEFKKIASSLLVAGSLLGSSSVYGVCSEVKPDVSKADSTIAGDLILPNVSSVSKYLGNINECFCKCGGKMGIGNRKLAKALGWFGTGVLSETLVILLVKLGVALSGKAGQSKVAGGNVVDITTRTTVTINKEGDNQKKANPVSGSVCENSVAGTGVGASDLTGGEKKGVEDASATTGSVEIVDAAKKGSCAEVASSADCRNSGTRVSTSRSWSSFRGRNGGFSSRIRGF